LSEELLTEGHHLVDISDNATLVFKGGNEIPPAQYKAIRMVLGLSEDKNISGAYPDLNLLSWSWPEMLGGGYHIMKLEGRYTGSLRTPFPFATHMGTAREITTTDTVFHANHVELELPKVFTFNGPSTVEVTMDIKQWYEGPHEWDLDSLDVMIMPNYKAQKMLRDNAYSVFSIGNVKTQ